MSMINFHDPTVINWNVDDNGKEVSLPIVNETKQVIDGKIPLEGLPDEQYRIQITGYVEINIKDKIDAPNKFKCDYVHGILYFDQSKNGASININKYYSRGQFYIASSRIWTKLSNTGKVIETMDSVEERLDGVLGVITNLDGSIDTAKGLRTELNTSITQGGTAKTNLDDSITTAIAKNAQLDGSISSSTTSKSNLDISIANASTSKSNLDSSIEEATTSKSNLESSISSGNTLKINLDESIVTGVGLKDNLDDNIITGNHLKVELPPLVLTATTKKQELDLSIVDANATNTTLVGSIDEGQGKVDEMVDAITNTTLIYRPAVSTYTDFTSYPNPERGYFVNVLDSQKWYRYDGGDWIHISTFDGTSFDTLFNYAKYIWVEEKEVLKDSNTLLLKGSVGNLDKLVLTDLKYQAEWIEGQHWTRSFQTITFLNEGGLPEDLTFRVFNLGKDLKLEIGGLELQLDGHVGDKKVELDNHVNNINKPTLNNHVDTTNKPALNTHTDTKKSELDTYLGSDIDPISGTKKYELNEYVGVKKIEINTHTTTKESELDTYKDIKQDELDIHNTAKMSELDAHTFENKTELNNHTDNKKVELDIHTTSNKSELDTYIIDTNKPALDAYIASAIKPNIDSYWMANRFNSEVKMVAKDSNTLDITHVLNSNNVVLLFDNTYGLQWGEGLYWTRNGQTVTFESSMPEDLEFNIIILG